jgi:hypothetical protein
MTATLLNPMGLSGPPTNYVQPSTAGPAADSTIADFSLGANMLDLTWPIPAYTQPGTDNPPPVSLHNPYILE